MTGSVKTTRFRFWFWLIRLVGVIVPRRLRADWRQEWEAELGYREAMLAEWDRLNCRSKFHLLWQSTSAFWDAIWLQQLRWEDEMIQDLRFGLRMFRKNPGFAFVAVLTLALGIGINTAIFSVVDGVLLRPLPYKNADRLVRVWNANQKTGQQYLEISYKDFQRFKQQSRAFTGMAAFSEALRILRDDSGEPNHITIARISDGFFPVLGISPVIGRDLLPEEYERGERLVIVSHRLWQSRYGSDPNITGRTVLIDGRPYTITGVAPNGYSYPKTADFWRPLTKEESEDDPELTVIGRLTQGASLDQANAEIGTIAQLIARNATGEKERTAWVQTMQAMVVREVRTPLLVLLGSVALVLLIACVNVANLLLARGLARQQEVAIRCALGAGRWRIVRQLLTESILIAALGGLLGILLGGWALKGITLLSPDNIPRLGEVRLDLRVIAVMIAVTTLAGVIFSVVPAIHASRLDLHVVIKGGHGTTGGLSKHRARQGLVIVEIALTTVLVISAGLLIKSFSRLLSFDRGFRAENVLVVPLNMRGQANPNIDSFYEQVLEQAQALPGVESCSLALQAPIETRGFKFSFNVEGSTETAPIQAVVRSITPDYFKTVAIPLLSGRHFNDQDRKGATRVAIINQTFAKSFLPNAPVGYRLRSDSIGDQTVLIVGVTGDVTPEAGEAARPMIYMPFRQLSASPMSLLVHTADNPIAIAPAIRERIRSLNPNVPLDRVYTLEQKLSEAVTSPRLTMLLVGLFAGLGLTLASIGIYGVMSYAVAERTKEIGVRRALGAGEASIIWSILRQGVVLTLAGLGIGLVIAVWATRLLSALLFNVGANDPLTFSGVASLLFAVAVVACFIPARRATKVDPLTALRYE